MNYIETGEIVSVHGIGGEVKVYPWADSGEFLEQFDSFYIQKNKMHYEKLIATQVRVHKNIVLVKFQGIDNPELARNLIGKIVYVEKDAITLEEGKYFISDLIGCKVVNTLSKATIGVITDVNNLGASDIYFIKGEDGKEYMFPAVSEFLVCTDIDNKTIEVKVIEGMFGED
ncbi:MAG: ribosome maturation factor RimM [Oscillospiraceae bacterium]